MSGLTVLLLHDRVLLRRRVTPEADVLSRSNRYVCSTLGWSWFSQRTLRAWRI